MILLLTALACFNTFPAPAEVGDLQTNQPDAVRFFVFGDAGSGNASQRHVANAIKVTCEDRGCDFGVSLGDNLYPRGMQSANDPEIDRSFGDYYKEITVPIYLVLGNHDYGHGRNDQAVEWQIDWANQHPQMVLPQRAYRFSAGPADLFTVDTTWIFWRGFKGQLAWLRDGLSAQPERFKVVFGHHPSRSNGEHGNAGRYEGLPFVPYASGNSLETFFQKSICEGADLYFSGHDHSLQWIPYCGVELIVSGAGSKVTPIEDRGNKAIFELSKEGFTWVELRDESMTVAFYTMDGIMAFEETKARRRRE